MVIFDMAKYNFYKRVKIFEHTEINAEKLLADIGGILLALIFGL